MMAVLSSNSKKVFTLQRKSIGSILCTKSTNSCGILCHTTEMLFSSYMTVCMWRSECPCRCSESLRLGRSGDRIPLGARFSVLFQTYLEAHTVLLYNGYCDFLVGKAAGVPRRGCELVGATHLLPTPQFSRDCPAMLWRDFSFVRTCTYLCVYECMWYVHMYVFVCMYAGVYVRIYVRMYVFMC